jgi:hypothetical protein
MIQQAKSNGPLAFVLASSIRRSGLRSTYLRSVFIISSRVFLLFCFCGPRQVVDGTFQVGAFGSDRCERRDKSSGPPLLKLSLKVKRNSTTLADLFTPLLFADLSSAVGTSLRSWSNDEFDDGVAHGREARLRRWAVDSFFSAPLVRDDGVGGMRKRSWS